jgi:hypothetical protein
MPREGPGALRPIQGQYSDLPSEGGDCRPPSACLPCALKAASPRALGSVVGWQVHPQS